MTLIKLRRHLPTILWVALLALSAGTGFAQEEAPAAAAEAAPEAHSVLHVIMEGGPMIIGIWLCIIATSVIMVSLIIQLALSLRKEKLAPPPLVEALGQTLQAGNYQEAWETCNANKNYLANVLKAALTRLGRGKEAVEASIAEHGLREATLIRTRNSYLSVIGVVSPMIGLLGTVIGMMGAFAVLAGSGIQDPRALSGKISEVLLATASGLFIAIPAFVSYYVFRNISQQVIVHADDVVNTLIMDIPFDELQGVQIGDNFNAGVPLPVGVVSGVRKVSMALTTNCPVCNGAVTPGSNPCPHCGSTLDWAA